MRLRRVEPILRRALRGPCAPLAVAGGARPRRTRSAWRAPSPATGHAARPRTRATPGPRLLVAVSGGADSTALLIGLCGIAHESGLELRAAHLHHGLRGAAADADLAFVSALCRRLRVPLTAARWDTRRRMRGRGLAGQAGLRTLRREFLLAAARRAGADAIVTAHTADDQLETLLMRLGRGMGLAGLAGMRPRRTERMAGAGAASPRGRAGLPGGAHAAAEPRRILWLKPLLGATRLAIEADLTKAGQAWREDLSNRDPLYARSRVRHEAVPALARALFPEAGAREARSLLARRAVRLAGEAAQGGRAIESLARRVLSTTCRIQDQEVVLDARRLRRLPGAVQQALLGLVWARARPDSSGLTERQRSALTGLIDTAHGGAFIHLPGGWSAERDHGLVRLRPGRDRAGSARVRRPPPGSSGVR